MFTGEGQEAVGYVLMAFRRFCEAAVAGAPIVVYGDGRQTRDFTFVGDLELLARIAGRPLDIRRHERESGDVQDTGADIARAREDLGFSPATDLATGLQAEFEWVGAVSRSLGVLPAASGG